MRQTSCFLRPRSCGGLLLGLLALAFTPGPCVAHADEPAGVSFISAENAFRRALKSKDAKERARAFEHLRGVRDARIVDAVVSGVKDVLKAQENVRKAQAESEKRYEQLIDALHDAQTQFEMSQQSGRDLERYNKSERKISKERDALIQGMKDLENDFARERSLEQAAVLVLGDLMEALPEDLFVDAHTRLGNAWRLSRNPDDVFRWVVTLAGVRKPAATHELLATAKDESVALSARIVAVDALAARRDGTLLGLAIERLAAPPESFGLLPAYLGALRTLHDRRAVEPLIAFLERGDLGRLREDGHLALLSLTGEKHGPYADPWKRWWEEHGKTFQMPPEPTPPGRTEKPEPGVTFYGVHTFSDRVLFIVDISGSMDKPSRAEGDGGKTKMEIARKELVGAVHLLPETAQFNVIFFNHAVIPWQSKNVTADSRTKKLLEAWVADQPAVGGTNIFDSLELGFATAVNVTGRPALDTVFFLTDGKPTAGKFQDPQAILERVREFNAAARLRIHAIGIGDDHDAEFMKELARIGDGQYVAR